MKEVYDFLKNCGVTLQQNKMWYNIIIGNGLGEVCPSRRAFAPCKIPADENKGKTKGKSASGIATLPILGFRNEKLKLLQKGKENFYEKNEKNNPLGSFSLSGTVYDHAGQHAGCLPKGGGARRDRARNGRGCGKQRDG